ncbi:MAG: SPOR domain-containing protein [Ignavibacteriales bacterium]|nr:SPOR domain-containing protein [Ignavibacteriales bacterium]
MKYLLKIFLFLISVQIFAQNVNVIPQLKMIESGKLDQAISDLNKLKQANPSDPNVIFLEAVVTEDGEKSYKLYEMIYNNFPNSQFADAALFRSFSYFYALGLYKKAEELKIRLAKDYPRSPYLKNTERSFPQVDEMLIVESTPYEIKNPSELKFTTQAGAFSNFQNAEDLKNRFLKDGLYTKIVPKTVNNINLHVVTVGNFATKQEAENFLIILENKYSLKGRVIKLD